MKLTETQEKDAYGISAEKTDSSNSNYELIERKRIGETPFEKVRTEKEQFIVMGKYRITQDEDDFQEILKECETTTNWKLLITVIGVIVNEILEETKSN